MGARSERATENQHLKRKSIEATKTCGQESNPSADVAPTSGLNGSKSNTTYLHCQLRSKQAPKKKNTPNCLQTWNYLAPCLPYLDSAKMQENRDPAIKLFGQKIPLPGEGEVPTVAGEDLASPVEIDMEREEDEERDGNDAEQRNTDEQKEQEDEVL